LNNSRKIEKITGEKECNKGWVAFLKNPIPKKNKKSHQRNSLAAFFSKIQRF